MNTALIAHPACRLHDPGGAHPECPRRIDAISDQLVAEGLYDLLRHVDAPPVTARQLERAHDAHYIESLRRLSPRAGTVALDQDTQMNPHTLAAAEHAAGACVAGVDLVMRGQARAAFCNVRPPGHHAGRASAAGFCVFNNIAIGVLHALDVYGIERLAIVDFDAHYGDGTAQILAGESRVLICSLFQEHLYPLDGDRTPSPGGVNIPLAGGSGGREIRSAVSARWLPALQRFRPQLICVSAGFDAHVSDPLADLRLADADFAWLSQQIVEAAERYADGRIVSTLEGGYHLAALARCAALHIRALAGLPRLSVPP